MKLQVERKLDVTVMRFDGHITMGAGSLVYRNAVREAIWDGHKKLALDYSRITFFDSSGLGEMVAAYTNMKNSEGELVLFDLLKQVTDRLMITKLFSVFTVSDSLESALAYFESRRNPETWIRERRYAHVSVLEIGGALTKDHGASALLTAAQAALDSGAVSIVALCPQLLDIDACGGKVLLDAKALVRPRGGDMVLAGIEDRLAPAMLAAGVTDLASFATVDQALGVFGLSVDRTKWRIEAAHAR